MTQERAPMAEAHRNPRGLRARLGMWFDPQHVCVLTIGKTASSAIIDGLIGAGVPAYQVHTLVRSPQTYLFVDGLPGSALTNAAYKAKVGLWRRLTRNQPKRFVTSFRDPFARNMSAFFEQAWKLNQPLETLETSELVALYDRHGPHDVTRTWFAENLTALFGLTQSQITLRDAPAKEIAAGPKRFLFLKHEAQETWEQALGSFVGADVHLTRRNDSADKTYADAIRRLRETWRPSSQIVRRSLDTALWDALYTDAEKEAIRQRWEIDPALAR